MTIHSPEFWVVLAAGIAALVLMWQLAR